MNKNIKSFKNDYKQSFFYIYLGFQGLFLLVLTLLKTVFFSVVAFYKAITKDVKHHDFMNNSNKKF